MVRRIASQVHKQAARLMRAGYIKEEPAWFQAVLDHPPLPLPSKLPPSRTAFDTPAASHTLGSNSPRKARARESRPLPISYIEDDIRRQFFRDHPFESFRPTSLIEGAKIEDEYPIRGKEWRRLRQRGRNPKPEDAIRFVLNLHQHHDLPLSRAYSMAISQFRSLRSEHHIATTAAAVEAEAYGAQFGPTENERMFEEEKESLNTWQRQEELDQGAIAARKKWRAIIDRQGSVGEWSRGQEYVRLWKEGIRPTYAPALTEPVITPEGLLTNPSAEQVAASADFMGLRI